MRLQADGLEVCFGERTALQGLDLALGAGEVIALLGPNGSGKSTALRALAGLVPLASGAVQLDGAPLPPPRERARRIACLFQEQPVAFDFRVRELVAMGGPRIHEALSLADLAHLADRPFSQLSGGERHRVHLARCLATGADVLLLDEPTNHLDLGARLRLLELLATRRWSVVLASHDLELASAADHALLLREGRVLAAGSPRAVLTPDAVAAAFRAPVRAVADPLGGAPFFRLTPSRPPRKFPISPPENEPCAASSP